MNLNRIRVADINPKGKYQHKNTKINHMSRTGIPGKTHSRSESVARKGTITIHWKKSCVLRIQYLTIPSFTK